MMTHTWIALVHVTAGIVVGFMAATMTIRVHVQTRDRLRGLIIGVLLVVLAGLTTIMVATGNGHW